MTSLGIRPAAVPAWVALQRAIADTTKPLPCTADAETWCRPDDEDLADYAIGLCIGRCPVLELCDRFATTNGERLGIWGGINREPRVGRPATTERKPA